MIAYLVMVPVGYLLGSLPFGLIIGMVAKRIDVRDFGSGKTGMTNVMRTIGVRAAILALLLDMGKSIVSVVLARIFFDSHGVEAAAALAALIGHNWPIFVGFRGGSIGQWYPQRSGGERSAPAGRLDFRQPRDGSIRWNVRPMPALAR